jgi:DNA invertase Pin-like site-specific DNA recombinase
VVGYVRETAGPQEGDTAFAQSERIRRWVVDSGDQLVAVCQDVRQSGHALGRDGYRALVGIVTAGQVDAVIVASLAAFSLDKIIQEIILWELRSRGVSVLSTTPEDLGDLKDPPDDRARLLIRDVLARVVDHMHLSTGTGWSPTVVQLEEELTETVIELIGPEGGAEASRS